jgi:toxin ParE1/3/4
MSLIPHYRPEARIDIAEIGLYFAERNQEVESRFYLELDKTIRMLADSPNLGERCQFRNPETKGMRIWQVSKFSNYLIFYLPKDDQLDVVRVIHGARDYAAIFNNV